MITFKNHVFYIIILILLFAVSYYDTLGWMFGRYLSADSYYSHGFLIPFISGYLIWEKRAKLGMLAAKPSNWGILVLLLGILMLIAGRIGAELFTMRFSLIILLAGLILFVAGKDFFKALMFPLVFLIFMIPLPYIVYDSIAFPLKLFAAKCATYSLQLIGIPILREGNIIVLASATLEVADACSGIRSLISLIALSVVYAYFTQKSKLKRIILVIASIPIAIIVNAFRVVVTGILAHYIGPETAHGFFHTFSGWLIFIIAFGLLLGLGFIVSKFPLRSYK